MVQLNEVISHRFLQVGFSSNQGSLTGGQLEKGVPVGWYQTVMGREVVNRGKGPVFMSEAGISRSDAAPGEVAKPNAGPCSLT